MSLVPKQSPNDWNKLQRTISQLASLKLGPAAIPTFAGVSVEYVVATSAIVGSLAATSLVAGSMAITSITIDYAYISTLAVNTITTATGMTIKVGEPLCFDGV